MSQVTVCPHCDARNRLDPSRPAAAGKCGRCGGRLFTGRPVALDEVRFDRHLRSDMPLLVDFWASWCGHSLKMAPAFEAAARELEPQVRLATVETAREQALAARFAIRATPTMILFRSGREFARAAGAMDLHAIVDWTRRSLRS